MCGTISEADSSFVVVSMFPPYNSYLIHALDNVGSSEKKVNHLINWCIYLTKTKIN